MTKEELKREAEEWLNKWELCNKCDHKVQCIEDNAICPQVVERAYLASAEPREKKIKALGERCLQLQKDKGELIDKVRELERRIASIRGSHRVDVKKLNARIEQVERLKKENAELKSGCGMCYRKDKENLTKAKELLRKILSEVKDEPQNYITSTTIAEAEQFLKEIK